MLGAGPEEGSAESVQQLWVLSVRRFECGFVFRQSLPELRVRSPLVRERGQR